jgi:hypothetical protein
MRFGIKVDQIDGAKLAMFAMLLDSKLARVEYVSFLMRVVLVVKEASADLAEQQTDQHRGD